MGLKVQPLFIHASSEDHFLVDIAASSLDYFAFFFLSLQLHQISLEAKKKSNTDVQVQMVSYSAKLGYNHNGIHLDPDLMSVVG